MGENYHKGSTFDPDGPGNTDGTPSGERDYKLSYLYAFLKVRGVKPAMAVAIITAITLGFPFTLVVPK